jgi:hypothetical protein
MITYIATPMYGYPPAGKRPLPPCRWPKRRTLAVRFVIQRHNNSAPVTWTYIAEFDDFATALAVRDDLNRSVGVP